MIKRCMYHVRFPRQRIQTHSFVLIGEGTNLKALIFANLGYIDAGYLAKDPVKVMSYEAADDLINF